MNYYRGYNRIQWVDWVRHNLFVKKTLWIAPNHLNIAINFHQDFMASMHSDFFQGKMDKGLYNGL
jgi:hypothetical protein